MRSVEEHRRVVASLLTAPAPVNVTLADAAGRVLADDAVASVSLPPFDNSAMDGYAVRAADIAGAGSHFLRSLANSDCLVDIAEDVSRLDAGAEVSVWLQRE
jgi:molybdopterin biosynthesis enzyme